MKKPMEILFLFPSFSGKGGIQRFNRTLVHASSSPESRVTIMSVVDSTAELESALKGMEATVCGTGGSRVLYFINTLWILSIRRWDVVFVGHVNLVRLISAMLPWTRSRNANTMLITHGVDVWGRISKKMARAIGEMWRVLSVSEYTRSSVLSQVRDLDESRCLVFPNALSETWKEQQDQESRCTFVLPKKFVLSVTRLESSERYKGIVSVIESIPGWTESELSYVVVGSGDDLGFLKRVARRCGVAHRVLFMEAVNDGELCSIYRRASVFLLPSGKEGFGIVFLEAMYFSVPVIAARSRGAVDVARDNQTAVLVAYGDVVGISHAVNQMVFDTELRSRLVAGGEAMVSVGGEFTESAMCGQWRSLLAAAMMEKR